ncbi:MAG: protein kinase [Nannocystis sp.]|uniref:serine/threonine-protein kinase n=1 Tax=Nannocystis sp. TaxID=1962667 RepID=UPI00242967C1|nr:serine/threonine protein kinase [Nannocystis sp.]MBK9757784.1 protein kinase [Nannocystis sp.]
MAPHAGSQSESTDASAWKPRSALAGTLLANRYRIAGLIGQGSTGAVFRADDIISGKPVAVRVLVPTLAQQPGLIPRIRARIERNNAIQQRDPAALINLVDIFDVGMTLEGELFVVSDRLDGDHLATMLSHNGRLPWSRARSLLIRLCQIVHGLHAEGIILGGLEARHCYAIRGKNKHEAIKVVNNAVIEQLASTIGPHAGHGATVLARYIAPEQACGEPIDARSDVYSFGVIAYELLSGSVPFTDANPVRLVSMHLQCRPRPPREVAPDAEIPAEVEAVLLRSLAKDPADRFPTMDAFAAALIAVPESSLPAGAHTVVSASTAASEIPTAPVDAAPTAAQAPASPIPAATPVAAPATPAPVAADATPATPPVADATTATPPVTDAPAPATTPVAVAATNAPAPATPPVTDAAPATPPVADAPAPAAPPVTTVSDPAPSAPNVPTPARRAASIPTHVTLPPGSLSSDMIRGAAAPPMPGTAARPATLPPTLGGLRLPPPPSLGRPSTIPPGGLILPPPPSLGVPSATPRTPSTASPTARPGSGVPLPTPRAPSAALPAGTLLRSGLAATPEPTAVPAASKPVLSDSPVAPVPADSKPVLRTAPPRPARRTASRPRRSPRLARLSLRTAPHLPPPPNLSPRTASLSLQTAPPWAPPPPANLSPRTASLSLQTAPPRRTAPRAPASQPRSRAPPAPPRAPAARSSASPRSAGATATTPRPRAPTCAARSPRPRPPPSQDSFSRPFSRRLRSKPPSRPAPPCAPPTSACAAPPCSTAR